MADLKKLLKSTPLGKVVTAVNKPAPATTPPQSIANRVRDVFDANTEADKQRRIAQGRPALERNTIQNNVRNVANNPTAIKNVALQRVGNRAYELKQNKLINNPYTRHLMGANLGSARAGVGIVEDFSGLYDLVTPGTGNNRLTQATRKLGAGVDNVASRVGKKDGSYYSSQVATNLASFLVPGMIASKVAKAPTVASKTASFVSKYPKVAKGLPMATNIATDTLQGAGQRTARGQDNSWQTAGIDAGISLATGGLLVGGSKLLQKGAQRVNKPKVPAPLTKAEVDISAIEDTTDGLRDTFIRNKQAGLSDNNPTQIRIRQVIEKNLADIQALRQTNKRSRFSLDQRGSVKNPLANDAPQVDKTDRPTVYHGTTKDIKFEDLMPSNGGGDSHPMGGLGVWFTDKVENAKNVATRQGRTSEKANVLSGKLDFKKPYKTDFSTLVKDIEAKYGKIYDTVESNGTMREIANKEPAIAFRSHLKSQGYDGIIIKGGNSADGIPDTQFVSLDNPNKNTSLANSPTGKVAQKLPDERGLRANQSAHDSLSDGLPYSDRKPIIPQSATPPQVGKTDKIKLRDDQRGFIGLPQDTPPPHVTTQKPPVGKKESYAIPEKTPSVPVDTPVQRTTPESVIDAKVEPPSAPKTTAVKLNTDRLNMDGGYDAMSRLDTETRTTIETMSNKDIQRIAKDSGVDTRTNTPEQIKTKIAEQLNVRRDAVRLMNEAEVARKSGDSSRAEELIKQASEQGRISRQQGTELAQQLQARRIIANELDTPQQKIFKLLDTAGVNPDVYAKRLANVDMNNAGEVVKAYRDLVPAKATDWITAVRYNSMLSSPLTHLTNAGSNAINVGVVAPIEKTVRGVLDGIGGLLGNERKYSSLEGASYAKGALSSLSKARDNFIDAMRGGENKNLDLTGYNVPLAMGGVKGGVDKTLDFPMRMLSATDGFFRALAEGGETSAIQTRKKAGIKVRGNEEALAKGEADYRLFQQDTDTKGQGWILDGMDRLTNTIEYGRNKAPILRWVLPFVKTPSNILKQSVEFSPAGFINAVNATDKTTALTRASIGTAIFGSALLMTESGEVTWSEPINPQEKAEFKASGKQPYSIKIGNNWVQLSKLPPAISFPFAISSAIKDAVDNKKMSESTADAIFTGISKSGQFLTDQSYLKSIGDTLKAIQSDPDKQVEAIANYSQQIVPFRALMGWVARMTDDKERMVNQDSSIIEKQVQQLMMNIPGLRGKLDTRNYAGQPIQTNNPVLNSFTPFRVTDDRTTDNDNSAQKSLLQMKDLQKQNDKKFKESFTKDEYDLYKLSSTDREEAISTGMMSQEQFDEIDRKALTKAKELGIKPTGKGQSIPKGLEKTDQKIKSFYNDRAYIHDNDYETWKKQKPDSESSKDMYRRANQIRPTDKPELPNTNAVAELYAEFKREQSTSGWTPALTEKKKADFLREAYKTELDDTERMWMSAEVSDDDIATALESGDISQKEMDRMIGVDNLLVSLGGKASFGKELRSSFGYGNAPNKSGGKSKKSKSTDIVALLNKYSGSYSSNRNALRNILGRAKI